MESGSHRKPGQSQEGPRPADKVTLELRPPELGDSDTGHPQLPGLQAWDTVKGHVGDRTFIGPNVPPLPTAHMPFCAPSSIWLWALLSGKGSCAYLIYRHLCQLPRPSSDPCFLGPIPLSLLEPPPVPSPEWWRAEPTGKQTTPGWPGPQFWFVPCTLCGSDRSPHVDLKIRMPFPEHLLRPVLVASTGFWGQSMTK